MQLPTEIPGVVHGLTNDSLDAARLYASLTGRTWRLWNNCEEPIVGKCDVVVCTTDQLTPRLMHHLYVRSAPEGVPGLLFAPSPGELEQICRRQAARFLPKQAAPIRRVFLYPLMDFTVVNRGTDMFLGGNPSSEELVAALSSEAAVLLINTHSDGIDFILSRRHFACPFPVPAKSGELMPICQSLNECRRAYSLKLTVPEAWDAGMLVPLTALRAHVIVLSGCAVIRMRDGILAPEYGIASALLQYAEFGAMITTWRTEWSRADGAHLNSLINDLSAGATVGESVAKFNHSTSAQQFGINLCLLGDPSFKLSISEHFSELPTLSLQDSMISEQQERISWNVNQQAHLLRDSTVAALRGAFYFRPGPGKELIGMLESFGRAQDSSKESANDIDGALLRFLGSAPWLDKFRAPFIIQAMSEAATCPSCFSPARAFWMTFPAYQADPWRVLRCSCCGDCILPDNWQVSLDLDQLCRRLVAVSGVPAGTKVLFCLNDIYGLQDSICQEPRYAQSSNTTLVFRIPEQLPPLPVRCNILLANQLRFGSIGFTFASLSDGTISTSRLELTAISAATARDQT